MKVNINKLIVYHSIIYSALKIEREKNVKIILGWNLFFKMIDITIVNNKHTSF